MDAPDSRVFDYAKKEGWVILSADTDFGAILADRSDSQPSFVLLRHDAPAMPEMQMQVLRQVLEITEKELIKGCIVSAHKDRVRVRELPIR